MSLTDMVIMPGADYLDACNAVREKTGGTEPIKSGVMGAQIRSIDTQEDLSPELSAQDRLIAQIESALEGKTGAGGAAGNWSRVAAGETFGEFIVENDALKPGADGAMGWVLLDDDTGCLILYIGANGAITYRGDGVQVNLDTSDNSKYRFAATEDMYILPLYDLPAV